MSFIKKCLNGLVVSSLHSGIKQLLVTVTSIAEEGSDKTWY